MAVSVERCAAALAGFALLAAVPLAWPAAVPAVALVSCGLLPRRGVRVGSRLVRAACKLAGALLLALSLPVVPYVALDNPLALPALLCTLVIPALAIALYGFEVGVVPRLGAKAAAYARALAAALALSVVGLAVIASYAETAVSDPAFLTERHKVTVPTLTGPREVEVPDWALFSAAVGLGLFLSAPGLVALARLEHFASSLEKVPGTGWFPGVGGKATQLFLLVVSASMIGVGPVIYSESGVLLAALGVSAFGAFLMLIAADLRALQTAYRELKAALRP